MINNSFPAYIFIRSCIFGLRAITPLCILFTASLPFIPRLPHPAIIIYPLSETIFYFFVYIPRKHYLQFAATHPAILPYNQRQTLFERCIASIPDINQYLSRWFLYAPLTEIKRENLKEFYRWALLNNEEEVEEVGEIENYVEKVEGLMGRELEEGRGKAECIKLTVDKVDMVHRPLLYYGIVGLVDVYTHVSLLFHGFRYYRSSTNIFSSFFTVFPFRPQIFLTRHVSPCGLSYWYRPHTSKTKLPILFVHGIGIGLYPYVDFLSRLSEQDEGVGVLAIELLPVSSRITKEEFGKEDMCDMLEMVIGQCGWDKFVLVGNSYGTVVTTKLLKLPSMKSRVASLVLVDPVSLLLHLPDVAYNFIRRQPHHANEYQLWYFACKDMGVAHTLSRRFFWSDNILWLEDLDERPDMTVSVFLSGRDLIVDTYAVGNYLTSKRSGHVNTGEDQNFVNGNAEEGAGLEDSEDWKLEMEDGKIGGWTGRKGWRVVWCNELDHAQVFDRGKWLDELVGEVRKRSDGQ